jgi:hypothetical protein
MKGGEDMEDLGVDRRIKLKQMSVKLGGLGWTQWRVPVNTAP